MMAAWRQAVGVCSVLLSIQGVACVPAGNSANGPPSPSREAQVANEFETRVAEFNRKTGAEQMRVSELQETLRSGAACVLIDVRESDEQQVSMLPGAQPVTPKTLADLTPPPSDAVVVTYCTVGYRSGVAAVALAERWGRPVYNLSGGIIAWFNAGGKVVGAAGEPVDKIHPYDDDWGRYVQPR